MSSAGRRTSAVGNLVGEHDLIYQTGALTRYRRLGRCKGYTTRKDSRFRRNERHTPSVVRSGLVGSICQLPRSWHQLCLLGQSQNGRYTESAKDEAPTTDLAPQGLVSPCLWAHGKRFMKVTIPPVSEVRW